MSVSAPPISLMVVTGSVTAVTATLLSQDSELLVAQVESRRDE
jgi:hypothetical protein